MLISDSFIGQPWPMRELLQILAQPDKALPVLFLMTYEAFEARVAALSEVRRATCVLVCMKEGQKP